jgi:hypothetical protein
MLIEKRKLILLPFFFTLMGTACGKLMPTYTPIPTPTDTPILTPTPAPLTDEMAIARIKEALTIHPIHQDTLEVEISRDRRRITISYETDYDSGSPQFRWQIITIGLTVARIIARVEPPISDGIRIAAMPTGREDIGLKLVVIKGDDIAAWSIGLLSDQVFISRWRTLTLMED